MPDLGSRIINPAAGTRGRPEECAGEIIRDLSARSGLVEGVTAKPTHRVIRALVPLRDLFGYSTSLRSSSQGRATFSMEFHGHQPVRKPRP